MYHLTVGIVRYRACLGARSVSSCIIVRIILQDCSGAPENVMEWDIPGYGKHTKVQWSCYKIDLSKTLAANVRCVTECEHQSLARYDHVQCSIHDEIDWVYVETGDRDFRIGQNTSEQWKYRLWISFVGTIPFKDVLSLSHLSCTGVSIGQAPGLP